MQDPDPDRARGLALLRERRWYEAHEALEAAWVREPAGPARDALRGWIHGAVALEHLLRGNRAGARLQAGKCMARIDGGGASWARAIEALVATGGELPPPGAWPTP